ncbi:MAG: DUF2997 domain-containing protein [Phycisphaerales bacterium]|nr:DUF2997 domain-containing protein [Phycisphaerales bacterium]
MTNPQFDIQIGKDGKVKLKVSGASGGECLALADMLKEIIGKEESRELTGEYYGSPGQVRFVEQAKGRVKR